MRTWLRLFGIALLVYLRFSPVSVGADGAVKDPSAQVLIDRVSALVEKGDYETLERLATQWRGKGSRLPLCRDGQSRLMILSIVQQRYNPNTPGSERKYTRLLALWKEALPDSTVRKMMNVLYLADQMAIDPPGEAFQRHLAEAQDDLASTEKAVGRTADWYFSYLKMAIATRMRALRLRDRGAYDALPDWQQVVGEGIIKYPDHLHLYFRAASTADVLGFTGGRDAFARHVCDLLPTRGFEPYTRIYWSAEREYQGDLFKPGNCDWPTFSSGFYAMLRNSPDSGWNLNHFLIFARQAGDKATARQLLTLIGDHPDPDTFAIEAKFYDIKGWANASAPRRSPVWKTEGLDPEGLAWSRDGKLVYVGFRGEGVQSFAVANGQAVAHLKPSSARDFCGDITVSPDGRRVAAVFGDESSSRAGNCTIWDTNGGTIVADFRAKKGPLRVVAFSPDGTQVLAGGGLYGGPSEVWHWTGGKEAATLPWGDTHRHSVCALGWAPDNSKIVFNCVRGFLTVAEDKADIRFVKQISVTTGSEIAELRFSPDGKSIAAACRGKSWMDREKAEGCVGIFRAKDMQPRADLLAPLTGGILSMDYSPDGKLIAAGGYDGFVYLLDATTLESKNWWNAESGFIRKVRWSPDGKHVAITAAGNSVSVWPAP